LIPSGYLQISIKYHGEKSEKGGQVFGKTLMPTLLEDAQNH
jgi:hypothetical protein